jgi:hypothetical protein
VKRGINLTEVLAPPGLLRGVLGAKAPMMLRRGVRDLMRWIHVLQMRFLLRRATTKFYDCEKWHPSALPIL